MVGNSGAVRGGKSPIGRGEAGGYFSEKAAVLFDKFKKKGVNDDR